MAKPTKDAPRSRIGLALAGGGPLGGVYELGAIIALDEAIEGMDVHELDFYVGVSAGSFVAANLANRFTVAQIARVFISNESEVHPITPAVFMQPAVREYWRSIKALPGSFIRIAVDFAKRPFDTGILGAMSSLQRVVPNGLFANDPFRRFLADLFSSRGHTDDFRQLGKRLFIVAADLDTGESVVFGSEGYDDVPISKAVQASTALPGLYPPVRIGERSFVDGGLLRTLHASAALDAGADLLLCINPIVPFDAGEARASGASDIEPLSNFGLPVILSQTMRSLIHSRLDIGMRRYEHGEYSDKDVVLFEPRREDSRMFFANPFSYSNRRRMCEHAYQSTRADLLAREKDLRPLLARHGLRLNMKKLRDPSRTFGTSLDVTLEARARTRLKNPATNALSGALDRLDELLT